MNDATERNRDATAVAIDPNAWLTRALDEVAPKPSADPPASAPQFFIRRKSSFTGVARPETAP